MDIVERNHTFSSRKMLFEDVADKIEKIRKSIERLSIVDNILKSLKHGNYFNEVITIWFKRPYKKDREAFEIVASAFDEMDDALKVSLLVSSEKESEAANLLNHV